MKWIPLADLRVHGRERNPGIGLAPPNRVAVTRDLGPLHRRDTGDRISSENCLVFFKD